MWGGRVWILKYSIYCATSDNFFDKADANKFEIEELYEFYKNDYRHIDHSIDSCRNCALPKRFLEDKELIRDAKLVQNGTKALEDYEYLTRCRICIVLGLRPPQFTTNDAQYYENMTQQALQQPYQLNVPNPPTHNHPTHSSSKKPDSRTFQSSRHHNNLTSNRRTRAPNFGARATSLPSAPFVPSNQPSLSLLQPQQMQQSQSPSSNHVEWTDLMSDDDDDSGSIRNYDELKEKPIQMPVFRRTKYSNQIPNYVFTDDAISRMTTDDATKQCNTFVFDTNYNLRNWRSDAAQAVNRNTSLTPSAKTSLLTKLTMNPTVDFTDAQYTRNFLNPETTDEPALQQRSFLDPASDSVISYATEANYETMHIVHLLGKNFTQDFDTCASIDIAFDCPTEIIQKYGNAMLTELFLQIGGNYHEIETNDIIGRRIYKPDTEWRRERVAKTRRSKRYLERVMNQNQSQSESKSENLSEDDAMDGSNKRSENDILEELELETLDYDIALKRRDHKLYHVRNQLDELSREITGLDSEFCVMKDGLVQFSEPAKEYNHVTFYFNKHGKFMQQFNDICAALTPDLNKYLVEPVPTNPINLDHSDEKDTLMTETNQNQIRTTNGENNNNNNKSNNIKLFDPITGIEMINIGDREDPLNVPNLNDPNFRYNTSNINNSELAKSLKFTNDKKKLNIELRNRSTEIEIQLNLPRNQYNDAGDQFKIFNIVKRLQNQHNYQIDRKNAIAKQLNEKNRKNGNNNVIYEYYPRFDADLVEAWRHKQSNFNEREKQVDDFNIKTKDPSKRKSKNHLYKDKVSIKVLSHHSNDVPPKLEFIGKTINLYQVDKDMDEIDRTIVEKIHLCKRCHSVICQPNYCPNFVEIRNAREKEKRNDPRLRRHRTVLNICKRCSYIAGHWKTFGACDKNIDEIKCRNCGGNHRTMEKLKCPLIQALAARILVFPEAFIMNSKFAFANNPNHRNMSIWEPKKVDITPTPKNWKQWHTKQALVDTVYNEALNLIELQRNNYLRVFNCKKAALTQAVDDKMKRLLETTPIPHDPNGNDKVLSKYYISSSLPRSNVLIYYNRRFQILSMQQAREDEKKREKKQMETIKLRYFDQNESYKSYKYRRRKRKKKKKRDEPNLYLNNNTKNDRNDRNDRNDGNNGNNFNQNTNTNNNETNSNLHNNNRNDGTKNNISDNSNLNNDGTNEINEMNAMNAINEMNVMNIMNETNETNEMNGINEANEKSNTPNQNAKKAKNDNKQTNVIKKNRKKAHKQTNVENKHQKKAIIKLNDKQKNKNRKDINMGKKQLPTSWKKKQNNNNQIKGKSDVNKQKVVTNRSKTGTNKSKTDTNRNKTVTNKNKTSSKLSSKTSSNYNNNNKSTNNNIKFNNNNNNSNERRNKRALNEQQQQLIAQFTTENQNQMQVLRQQQLACINFNQGKNKTRKKRINKSDPMYGHETSSESDSDDEDMIIPPNLIQRQLSQHQIESTIVAMQRRYQPQPNLPTNSRSSVVSNTLENENQLESNMTSIQPRLQKLQTMATLQTGITFQTPVPPGVIPPQPIPAAPNIYGPNQNVLQHSLARASTGFKNAATANIPHLDIYQSDAVPLGTANRQ